MFFKEELLVKISSSLSFLPHRTLLALKTGGELIFLLFQLNKYFIRGDNLFRAAKEYVEYLDNHKKAMTALSKWLDQKSIAVVERIIKRWEMIYTQSILNYDDVYIDSKLLTEQFFSKLHSYQRKYSLMKISPEVFLFHNGLVFVPKRIIKKYSAMDVLDCGGYTGDSALMFNKIYSFRKIFSFEPLHKNCQMIEAVIKKYGCDTVEVVEKAVGERGRIAGITDEQSGSKISQLNEGETIHMVTIDSFTKERKIRVGLIKMDIEGYEMEALKGARSTIRRFKPILLIAIYHKPRDFFEIKQYLESLRVGYTFKIRNLNPLHDIYETTLIVYPQEG